MLRALFCVVLAGLGCTKAEPTSQQAPPPPAPAPAPAPAVAPPRSPFGDARLIVDAEGVKLDGAALGPSPTAAQLGKLPRDAVALAFTDDAPADRVLGVLATLHGAGHARVDLTALVAGAPKVVCAATPVPASTRVIQIVLVSQYGRLIEIGFENQLPVFTHERATGIPLELELATPFFADYPALAVAAAPGWHAGDLAALLDTACRQRSAVRAIPVPTLPEVVLKPLCRKLISRGALDPEKVRDAMPSLQALDRCYQQFEPHMGELGKVTMTFDIEPTGKLANASAKGLHPDVNRCITWLLGTVVFEHPPAKRTRAVVTAECNTRCCNGD